MVETWEDIKDYEGYYKISNTGEVINVKTKKQLVIQCGDRYKQLILSKDGKSRKEYIHRLIAMAFIPNEYNKRCVNHKDGDKFNNDISNLEWVTHSENNKHAMNTGLNQAPRGHDQNFSKLTNEKVMEICKRLELFELPIDICVDYNVSSRTIYDIKLGNTWSWLTGRGDSSGRKRN